MEQGNVGRYYNISPTEAEEMIFSDAAVLFFRDDGTIAASRAPAAILQPGGNMADYVRDLSALSPSRLSAPEPGNFGFSRCKLKRAALKRASAMSGADFSDSFFFRTAPEMPLLGLALLPLADAPVPDMALSMEAANRIAEQSFLIRNASISSEFYCRAAEAAVSIARFTGTGISVSDCEDYIFCSDEPDAGAFLALTMVTAMLFRRCADMRGFNLSFDVMSDGQPAENGAFSKTGGIPLLRFDAVLAEEARDGELPEIGALRRIAALRTVPFDCYRRSRISADGKNEERLYVCFSPISFDGGLYGFKADAKQSLEDNGTRITR